MERTLQITAAQPDPDLLDLPWDIPLARWPASVLAALPRGLSRHVVRFVRLGGRVIAIKEIGESVAYNEYELLRKLRRLDVPSVEPLAVITGRHAPDGEPLEAVLITEHLPFSLPYRSLFSHVMGAEVVTRLIDALVVLLVRLHLVGFYWGDVSLSNTLFRRDAESFAAYLVDAETGALYPALTPGQRNYDIDLARTNIIGELMDLSTGSLLDEDIDPIAIGDALVERYQALWDALTGEESFGADERWRVAKRVEQLHDLGFDVDELEMTTVDGGARIVIQPKVVDAGHHARRLARLTGLTVQEQQARRLLADLDHYRVMRGLTQAPEQAVALAWLADEFQPAVDTVPPALRGKLEPAQLFHEILDHRWYMSQEQQRDVPTLEAARDYVNTVLADRPDEAAVLGPKPGTPEAAAREAAEFGETADDDAFDE